MSLTANITLVWKDLPGTNTLAYFVHSQFGKKKRFVNSGLEAQNVIVEFHR